MTIDTIIISSCVHTRQTVRTTQNSYFGMSVDVAVAQDNEEQRRNNGMSVNFSTKYFISIHNVLNNGQHPLVRATRNIVKDVDELGNQFYILGILEISEGRRQKKNEKFQDNVPIRVDTNHRCHPSSYNIARLHLTAPIDLWYRVDKQLECICTLPHATMLSLFKFDKIQEEKLSQHPFIDSY